MDRLRIGWLLTSLCALLLLSFGPSVRAEEAGKGAEHKESPKTEKTADEGVIVLQPYGHYEVLRKQDDGRYIERTYDLAVPAERKELAEDLAQGRIKELEESSSNIMTFATDLGIWTVVVFLILLALLYKLAWGPMLAGLKKREESIAGALEASHKAQEEAKKMQLQLEQQMAEANQKVGALMEETRKAAARTQEEMLAKARTDIAAERERLRRELDTARDQALQDLSSYAAKLATDVAAKVLVRELNVADQHRLVEEALGEMRQAAADRNRVLTGA